MPPKFLISFPYYQKIELNVQGQESAIYCLLDVEWSPKGAGGGRWKKTVEQSAILQDTAPIKMETTII